MRTSTKSIRKIWRKHICQNVSKTVRRKYLRWYRKHGTNRGFKPKPLFGKFKITNEMFYNPNNININKIWHTQ